MSLEYPGIYFLASRFMDGSYLYKVGKSKCIKDRINQYPQNFSLILAFECLNRDVSETEVIGVVEKLKPLGVVKCEKGLEFFTSERDLTKEIKLALYDWYYEIERTRTQCITDELVKGYTCDINYADFKKYMLDNIFTEEWGYKDKCRIVNSLWHKFKNN